MSDSSMFHHFTSSIPSPIVDEDTKPTSRPRARGTTAPPEHRLPKPEDVARSLRAHSAKLPHAGHCYLFVALNGTWQIRGGDPSLTSPGWTSQALSVPGTNAQGKPHRFRSIDLARQALNMVKAEKGLPVSTGKRGRPARSRDEVMVMVGVGYKNERERAMPAIGSVVLVNGAKLPVVGHCEVQLSRGKRRQPCVLVALPEPLMTTLGLLVHVVPVALSMISYP